jgi:hypothetical protein
MEISADRAYWVVQGLSARRVRFQFACRIGGADVTCEAEILDIDRELQLAIVELFEEGGTKSWCRPIPLGDATFYVSMIGESGIEDWIEYSFHMVLVLQYPDATKLLFTERF